MEQDNQLSKPKVSASAQRHLDKTEAQFEKYSEQLTSMAQNDIRSLPVKEEEMQTKLSSREIHRDNAIYLKPERTIPDGQKFNEAFAKEYEFDCQLVNFIAEHKEIIGEKIELWTHPYGGKGASFWKVPVNKPVWGPRYLAEQIKESRYVKYISEQAPNMPNTNSMQMYGGIIAETQVQRLDAHPVSTKKTFF